MRNFFIKHTAALAVFSHSTLGRLSSALALVVTATVTSSAAVTIPDSGVDMPGYVTAAILAIGGVMAAVVGGYFAFLLIKKGMSWAGKALG
jgi:hypothetical protein